MRNSFIMILLACNFSKIHAQVTESQLEKIHQSVARIHQEKKYYQIIASEERMEGEEQRAKHESEMKQFRDELREISDRYHKDVISLQIRIDEQASALRRIEDINVHLRGRILNDLAVDPDQKADGRIISVDPQQESVEIDLGHADAAFVGLQLDVLFPYELTGDDPTAAEAYLSLLVQQRCRIEITSVDSNSRSTAKLLAGSGKKSLQQGAIVASPLWERGQRQNIVLLEDVEHEDLIQQTLWEAGFQIVRLADRPNVHQLIDKETRYVVIDDFDGIPDLNDETVPANYWKSIAVARDFAIQVLDAEGLLAIHPIPEPGSEKALQMLERLHMRKREMIIERIEMAEKLHSADDKKNSASEVQPAAKQAGNPFDANDPFDSNDPFEDPK